jgi:hypothetical protein
LQLAVVLGPPCDAGRPAGRCESSKSLATILFHFPRGNTQLAARFFIDLFNFQYCSPFIVKSFTRESDRASVATRQRTRSENRCSNLQLMIVKSVGTVAAGRAVKRGVMLLLLASFGGCGFRLLSIFVRMQLAVYTAMYIFFLQRMNSCRVSVVSGGLV